MMIDHDYLQKILLSLLNIASPSGYSDQIVHFVGAELDRLGLEYNVTRRGAIRATLRGRKGPLDRAITAHLDTLGAMVNRLKENGRLGLSPIGTWSSRFAEGGRVTVFTPAGPQRGTVLPLKASGHVYGDAIDSQPSGWDFVEGRVDVPCGNARDLQSAGFTVGDFVAFDALPEITPNGFVNARHLDDKAGVAVLLTAAKGVIEAQVPLPVDCHMIFTIFEEVGHGASAAVYGDVAEMVVIEQAPVATGQNALEDGVTIGMMDQSGPFDYHLSHKLIGICEENKIAYAKDVFRFYRSDSASAIEAGNDTRTALVCFGVDGSHGYERTRLASLDAVTRAIVHYMQSAPTFRRDKDDLATLKDFPHQPTRDPIQIKT
ncbi:MAG: osmoprotectant NAGGN system M42 family peptidase [Desulfobacterales bacterium]|jgi:peptidase M42 family hydrolase